VALAGRGRPHAHRSQSGWSTVVSAGAGPGGVATTAVTECHRVTGQDCFLLKLHARRIEELEEALDTFLVHGQTVTSIAVTSPIPPRPLPLGPRPRRHPPTKVV
jgi:DNA-binding Lrp family transcriptional regulator